jgi:hypothetical protein
MSVWTTLVEITPGMVREPIAEDDPKLRVLVGLLDNGRMVIVRRP